MIIGPCHDWDFEIIFVPPSTTIEPKYGSHMLIVTFTNQSHGSIDVNYCLVRNYSIRNLLHLNHLVLIIV